MAISTAVGLELRSKVVGYELLPADFSESTPNLPQSIAIFGQANTDKQTGLTNAPVRVTSAAEAGEKYGFGSQIHIAMRILRSRNGDTTGGIPTVIYPQVAPGGGAAQVDTITVSGTATEAATHIVYVSGRSNFDGASLEIAIAKDDTATIVGQKIADAINNAQSCPVSASNAAGVVTITTKWVGESAGELNLEVVAVDDKSAGMAYVIAEVTPAAGDSSAEITSSLELFGETWHTIVVNPYPKSRFGLFEEFNGVPGIKPGTGRYLSTTWKPFVCFSGNTDTDKDTIITGLDNEEATIAMFTAPGSKGWNVEVAANAAALAARLYQDTPHLDISGLAYPDMPVPRDGDIGDMKDYLNRDFILKGGSSTVIIQNGKYRVVDAATTYSNVTETEPQFRYVRTLMIDFNMRYSYYLNEQLYVVDHVILSDNAAVSVEKTVKPSTWKSVLIGQFNDFASRGMLLDPDFSAESLDVNVGETNPNRFESRFKYKRTGLVRIASTTAEAGFGFSV